MISSNEIKTSAKAVPNNRLLILRSTIWAKISPRPVPGVALIAGAFCCSHSRARLSNSSILSVPATLILTVIRVLVLLISIILSVPSP